MVNRKYQSNRDHRINQAKEATMSRPAKIGANTSFSLCSERITAFGGLLGLVKFLDLFQCEKIFESYYQAPSRKPLLGHYRMVLGIVLLLFIGFNRIWHMIYIRMDSMVCAILGVNKLPDASTFWRYINALGLNEAKSLLKVASVLRERVWIHCRLNLKHIHIDIDTTVETIYGEQEGGRVGHNTSHRGKKGYRPVLCFIEETREFLTGKLRKGETISGKEISKLISSFHLYLPSCVKKVTLRADGEFFGRKTINAALAAGYHFIIGIRRSTPKFNHKKWYHIHKKDKIQYNECLHQPNGWQTPCRFVAMRIHKRSKTKSENTQLQLWEDDEYTYRTFATDLKGRPHSIIHEYDKRADVENLIGEAKREGLAAIPSTKFKNNYAYFQIVMLTYNIWRYFKMVAEVALGSKPSHNENKKNKIATYTELLIRTARLKLLMIGAKIVFHANRYEVKYSIYDTRVVELFRFYNTLDQKRHNSSENDWENLKAAWMQENSCAKNAKNYAYGFN